MIGGMTKAAPASQNVLCASMALPDAAEGDAPEWVQLTPVLNGEIATFDGRGPYHLKDAAAVIAASMAYERGILIDENHATDLAAPTGKEAPARGWIKEMQARADGIWGRVEWTKAGRELVADKAYRGISPVMNLNPDKKTVRMIPRASLVNLPNLRGMNALNQEQPMGPMAKLAAALGLAEDASEEAILTAIKALKDKKPEGDMPALQSALAEIGTVLGVEGEAKPATIVAAAKVAAGGKDSLVTLQAQVTSLTTELTTLKTAGTRAASEAFIDKAIADRRAGVNAANREDLITLHMSQKDAAEKLILGMPMLSATGTVTTPPVNKDGVVSLNAEQQAACAALGVSEADYKKSLAEEAR
jgi:phage I-like protein